SVGAASLVRYGRVRARQPRAVGDLAGGGAGAVAVRQRLRRLLRGPVRLRQGHRCGTAARGLSGAHRGRRTADPRRDHVGGPSTCLLHPRLPGPDRPLRGRPGGRHRHHRARAVQPRARHAPEAFHRPPGFPRRTDSKRRTSGTELRIFDAADRESRGAFVARAVRLDGQTVVRLRRRNEKLVEAWATTPFAVLVTRTVEGELTPSDVTVSGNELLAALTVTRSEYMDPGAPQDLLWRSELPSNGGWQPVDNLPVQVVRDLAEQGVK